MATRKLRILAIPLILVAAAAVLVGFSVTVTAAQSQLPAVTNLTATVLDSTHIRLDWSYPGDPGLVHDFGIGLLQSRDRLENGFLDFTDDPTARSYTDSNAPTGQQRCYIVVAESTSGRPQDTSPQSNTACATAQPVSSGSSTSPSPSGGQVLGDTNLSNAGTPPSSSITGVNLYICPDGSGVATSDECSASNGGGNSSNAGSATLVNPPQTSSNGQRTSTICSVGGTTVLASPDSNCQIDLSTLPPGTTIPVYYCPNGTGIPIQIGSRCTASLQGDTAAEFMSNVLQAAAGALDLGECAVGDCVGLVKTVSSYVGQAYWIQNHSPTEATVVKQAYNNLDELGCLSAMVVGSATDVAKECAGVAFVGLDFLFSQNRGISAADGSTGSVPCSVISATGQGCGPLSP